MFNRRKSRLEPTYTGVNHLPPSNAAPSNNALAAALTIGKSLKEPEKPPSARSATVKRSPSTQIKRSPSIQGNVRRSGSIQYITKPAETPRAAPKTRQPLSAQFEEVSMESNEREMRDLRLRHEPRTASMTSQTRMVTKYIPTATGIKTVQVPESTFKKEVARNNSLRVNSNRTQSLRQSRTSSLVKSRTSSLQSSRLSSLRKNVLDVPLESEESVEDQLAELDKQIERERAMQEKLRQKQREYEELKKERKRLEEERKRNEMEEKKEKERKERKERKEMEKKRELEEIEKESEERETELKLNGNRVENMAESNENRAEPDGSKESHESNAGDEVDSSFAKYKHDEAVQFHEKNETVSPETASLGSPESTYSASIDDEADIAHVDASHLDTTHLDSEDEDNLAVPTIDTSNLVVDEVDQKLSYASDSSVEDGNMLAKNMRSTLGYDGLGVVEAPHTLQLPSAGASAASSIRSSGSRSPERRPVKSAMKVSRSQYLDQPRQAQNAATDVYLSLTTAENTRLNSKLSAPQMAEPRRTSLRKRDSAVMAPAPKNGPKPNGAKPTGMASRSLRAHPSNQTIQSQNQYQNLGPHQYSISPHPALQPGYQSPSKKKAAELYAKAQARPISVFKPNRSSSFSKNDEEPRAEKSSVRDRQSLRVPETAPPAPKPNVERPVRSFRERDEGSGHAFSSRYPDSDEEPSHKTFSSRFVDSDDEGMVAHTNVRGNAGSFNVSAKTLRDEEPKREKKMGRLRKLFGRS